MTGVVAAGVGAGTMIGAPVSEWLISSYGWRDAYLVTGITVLIVFVAVAQLLKRDPAEIGQLPDGVTSSSDSRGRSTTPPEITSMTFDEARHTRQFWMFCLLFTCFGLGLQGILVHIVPYATDLGIPPAAAAGILVFNGAANLVGRIVIGGVSDRIGNRVALIGSTSLAFASMVLLFWAKEIWMLYLFALIFGLGCAGMSTIISTVVAEMFGMRAHGAVLGGLTFAWSSGSAASPLIIGRIFDVNGSYQLAFVMATILASATVVMAAALKPTTIRS